MNTKQHFTNVTELKAAVQAARATARAEAVESCGRSGCLQSRGAWIKVRNVAGEVIQGECDTWEFTGTAKQFKELADLLRYGSACTITIEGGWNWAASPRAMADLEYDPWVSEWSVEFGVKGEEEPAPADAAVALEHAMERAQVQANEQGYEAGMEGKQSSDNPYEPGSAMERAWGAGLEQARGDKRDMREMGLAPAPAAPAVEDIKAQTIEQFRGMLHEARKCLAAARRQPLAYVVICDSIALRYEIVAGKAISPTLAKPWTATRFSLRDATAVAAATKNGAGKVGEVHTVVEAIEAEIKTLEHLLGAMTKEAA